MYRIYYFCDGVKYHTEDNYASEKQANRVKDALNRAYLLPIEGIKLHFFVELV